jgi:hypothetical protein
MIPRCAVLDCSAVLIQQIATHMDMYVHTFCVLLMLDACSHCNNWPQQCNHWLLIYRVNIAFVYSVRVNTVVKLTPAVLSLATHICNYRCTTTCTLCACMHDACSHYHMRINVHMYSNSITNLCSAIISYHYLLIYVWIDVYTVIV